MERQEQKIAELIRDLFQQRLARQQADTRRVTVGFPYYDDREILNALDSLLNIRISQGDKVAAFEKAYARALGMPYAVAVNSGTSANLLALAALIEDRKIPRGSEVIVPAATFSSVVSPILQLGLVPVYADVDAYSWNINPREVARAISRKTRVLMPVHSFGNPADMPQLMALARRHRLAVLEDCCEAHGASIRGKPVGSFGDLSTLSFFVAHNLTTGEGGMVFARTRALRTILTSLREFGRLPPEISRERRYVAYDRRLGYYDARNTYVRLGYNVRMTDIAAALGIEQLRKLAAMNRRRCTIVRGYQRGLAPYRAFLRMPTVRPGTVHSFYGFPFIIEKNAPFARRELVEFLERRGIETRSFFGGCLPDQPAFRAAPGRAVGRLPVSRWIRDNGFFIGCHPALAAAQVSHVITTFAVFFARFRLSTRGR